MYYGKKLNCPRVYATLYEGTLENGHTTPVILNLTQCGGE